jgi:hypothetical protein
LNKTLIPVLLLALSPLAQAQEGMTKAPPRTKRHTRLDGCVIQYGRRAVQDTRASFNTFDGKTLSLDVRRGSVVPGFKFIRRKGQPDRGQRPLRLNQRGFMRAQNYQQFEQLLRQEYNQNQDYLKAADAGNLQPYSSARRMKQFVVKVGRVVDKSHMSQADKNAAHLALSNIKLKVASSTAHRPAIGNSTNYHPYRDPPIGGVRKLAKLATQGEAGVFDNIQEFLERARTTRAGSTIDHHNIEVSKGQVVQLRTTGVPVSIKKGTEQDYMPKYEVLKVSSGQHAGQYVYRDGDHYYLHKKGLQEPTEVQVADGQLEHKEISNSALLTVRDRKPWQKLRAGVKLNWRNPGAMPSAVADNIGWWGQCHTKSWFNSVGARSGATVTMFREASKQEATLSPSDQRDTIFVATDATSMVNPRTRKWVNLDRVDFVGFRKDSKSRGGGGYPDQLVFKTGGWRPLKFGNLVFREIKNARGQVEDQTYLFQEHHYGQNLKKNPDLVSKDRDVHVIKGNGRKVVATVKYQDFVPGSGRAGRTSEQTREVSVDASGDKRVFIGSQINRGWGQAPKKTEYYYNPGGKTVESLTFAWKKKADGAFGQVLENRQNAETGPEYHVISRNVSGFNLGREVASDPAAPFVRYGSKLVRNNVGAVIEKSVHQPVWNYALTKAAMALQGAGSLFENLQRRNHDVSFALNTKGGSTSANVKLKLSERGKIAAAEFERPGWDFWHATNLKYAFPVAGAGKPRAGTGSVNYSAIDQGFSWTRDASGQPKQSFAFYQLAGDVFYAGHAHPGANHVYAIQKNDGSLYTTTDAQVYQQQKARLLGQ